MTNSGPRRAIRPSASSTSSYYSDSSYSYYGSSSGSEDQSDDGYETDSSVVSKNPGSSVVQAQQQVDALKKSMQEKGPFETTEADFKAYRAALDEQNRLEHERLKSNSSRKFEQVQNEISALAEVADGPDFVTLDEQAVASLARRVEASREALKTLSQYSFNLALADGMPEVQAHDWLRFAHSLASPLETLERCSGLIQDKLSARSSSRTPIDALVERRSPKLEPRSPSSVGSSASSASLQPASGGELGMKPRLSTHQYQQWMLAALQKRGVSVGAQHAR